jgi:hypothetical protein
MNGGQQNNFRYPPGQNYGRYYNPQPGNQFPAVANGLPNANAPKAGFPVRPMAPGMSGNPVYRGGSYNNDILQNQIIQTLIQKNFELGQSHTDMAKGVVDFCKNLTSLIAPVLESKDKENKRLKRLL